MINTNMKQSFYDKYMPYLMALVLLVGLSGLCWWGYRLYLNKIEQAAFKDLAESIESFDKFIAMDSEKQVASGGVDRLDDIERAFDIGVKKYGNSKLIPFFNLYKADALIQKGDFTQALGALQSAINKAEKDSPFYYLLLTKKALLQSDNEGSKEQGLKELNELLLDKNNPFDLMAGYYLGLHYYHLNEDKENLIKAKNIWQEALNRQEHLTTAKESSWAELIRAKLKNIS